MQAGQALLAFISTAHGHCSRPACLGVLTVPALVCHGHVIPYFCCHAMEARSVASAAERNVADVTCTCRKGSSAVCASHEAESSNIDVSCSISKEMGLPSSAVACSAPRIASMVPSCCASAEADSTTVDVSCTRAKEATCASGCSASQKASTVPSCCASPSAGGTLADVSCTKAQDELCAAACSAPQTASKAPPCFGASPKEQSCCEERESPAEGLTCQQKSDQVGPQHTSPATHAHGSSPCTLYCSPECTGELTWLPRFYTFSRKYPGIP